MIRTRLEKQLIDDEGLRSKVYKDSEGIETIGVGRNLRDKGLSRAECMILLGNDIDDALADARALVPNFDQLNDARQEVLVNMSFNLGRARLAGFKKFLAAIAIQDFGRAAVEMMDSKWAQQVGSRAVRLRDAMRDGVWK